MVSWPQFVDNQTDNPNGDGYLSDRFNALLRDYPLEQHRESPKEYDYPA